MNHPADNGRGVEEGRDSDVKANSTKGVSKTKEGGYEVSQEPVFRSVLDIFSCDQ